MKIEVTGLKELDSKIDAILGGLEESVQSGVNDAVTILRSDIVENYVSGQVLGVVTENLRSNILEVDAEKDGDSTYTGKVTSNANANGFAYDKYHEFESGHAFMRPAVESSRDRMEKSISQSVKKVFKG